MRGRVCSVSELLSRARFSDVSAATYLAFQSATRLHVQPDYFSAGTGAGSPGTSQSRAFGIMTRISAIVYYYYLKLSAFVDLATARDNTQNENTTVAKYRIP